ncbi:pyridoxal-phosphate dependent enzyme [Elioraea sp. Yellowstone]|uniref:1-aminocyclopropane-1-carboxylate deaminase/D-cysteine desulfhydrase n=1 Tax=Elioraea sp. Yellowstone TaxID=2592070 RepID=UPI0011511EDC|nr:pyridoxal-phosphate dependent enzyme [Elioraea sp. Yellowstone]TQF81287.1 pyridoxal-phosphate dependent enzyme [Elioraea sp. Yellowstone]
MTAHLVPLGRWPTPFEPAPRLSASLGREIWFKREDLAGPALGGNKIRQLEWLLGAALAEGADAVLTTAAAQSNFCRALAGTAAKLGLACTLVLRGPPPPCQGNLLLDRLFGAEIRFVAAADPWHPRLAAALDEAAASLRARGYRPYAIHLPGASAALAAQAWAEAAAELDADWRAAGIDPAALVVAAGSGLTAAGLALGLARAGRRCRVRAISVQQPRAHLAAWMTDVARRTAERAGWPLPAALPLDIDDAEIGPGYGMPSPASLAALLRVARCEGVALDPAYAGKAMAGLIAALRAGTLPPGPVVFLHSGGLPGLFAAADAVAGAAA